MVPKPEYGDLHRWKVSIGVLLIIASVAIPWLVLREPFSFLTPTAQVEQLTGRSRTFFRIRQWLEIAVSVASVIAAPTFLAFGIRYLRQGLRGWSQLQEKFDRDQLADNQKVAAALPEATREEIAQEARIESPVETKAASAAPSTLDVGNRNLRSMELRFGEKLKHTLSDLYEFKESPRIGNSIVDYLLLAKERPVPDILIEIKFMGLPIDVTAVKRIIEEYREASRWFEFNFDRQPICHIFLIFAQAPILEDVTGPLQNVVNEGPFPMRLHILSRSAFERLRPSEIKRLLSKPGASGISWTA